MRVYVLVSSYGDITQFPEGEILEREILALRDNESMFRHCLEIMSFFWRKDCNADPEAISRRPRWRIH